MPNNIVVIQEFIAACFSDHELTVFCEAHFQEVIPDFSPEMSIRRKAGVLVGYCQRRSNIDSLLQKLEAERPKPYAEQKTRLEQEHVGSSINEKFFADMGGYQEMLASVQTPELTPDSSLASAVETNHPLSRSAEEVKRWFLTELSVEEQVFVVAATLFPMLDRKELMEIYREMLTVLNERPSPQGKGVARA